MSEEEQTNFAVLYDPRKIYFDRAHELIEKYLAFTGIYEDFEEHYNVKTSNIELGLIEVDPRERKDFGKFARRHEAVVQKLADNIYFLKRMPKKMGKKS